MQKAHFATSSPAAFGSKPHYALLDGLRGVAALLVLWYHVFEGFSFALAVNTGNEPPIWTVNHGYLAVDFFFILSGFVIGYAYDDRWGKSLSLGGFFKRRLIRLHPLVVLGAVLGAVAFLLQGSVQWDGTHVATSQVMLAMLCAMFMLPALPGARYEVRGNGEMFPLNGPCWSLFFEYVGNVLYALLLRRLPTAALAILTLLLGITLVWFTTEDVSGYGMLGIGWTLDTMNFLGGALRMMVPYCMGLLLSRVFRPVKVHGAFWICTLVLLVLFHVPYIASQGGLCLNGVFESVCIVLVFPLLVLLAASGKTTDPWSTSCCKFLGNISYPLYIVHYPVMYLFYDWLIKGEHYTLAETWQMSVAVMMANVVLAYLSLKFYDIPVRRWLTDRFMRKNTA